LVPVAALVFTLVSGCGCDDDFEHLNIGVGGPAWSTCPRWNAGLDVNADFMVHVTYGLNEAVPNDLVELYRDGQPVPLKVTHLGRIDESGSCPHNKTDIAPTEPLEPGEYTLIHRLARGTGKPLGCSGDAVVFDGDSAMSTTLKVAEVAP